MKKIKFITFKEDIYRCKDAAVKRCAGAAIWAAQGKTAWYGWFQVLRGPPGAGCGDFAEENLA